MNHLTVEECLETLSNYPIYWALTHHPEKGYTVTLYNYLQWPKDSSGPEYINEQELLLVLRKAVDRASALIGNEDDSSAD
jgi:hypothetical protein